MSNSAGDSCPRCGWVYTYDVVNALVTCADGCISPFAIGERLYWRIDDDLPPLLVSFKALTNVHIAYVVGDDARPNRTKPVPIAAEITVDFSRVYPEHTALLGDLLSDSIIVVPTHELTKEVQWPVLEIV